MLEYYCALSTIYKFYCINSVEARLRARVDVSFSPRPPYHPVAGSTRIFKRERETYTHKERKRKKYMCVCVCERDKGRMGGRKGGRKVRNHNCGHARPSARDSTIKATYFPVGSSSRNEQLSSVANVDLSRRESKNSHYKAAPIAILSRTTDAGRRAAIVSPARSECGRFSPYL